MFLDSNTIISAFYSCIFSQLLQCIIEDKKLTQVLKKLHKAHQKKMYSNKVSSVLN